MTLFPQGWTHYLVGGLTIGAGVSVLFALTGLIGGMSSVYSSTWSYVIRHPYFQQPPLVKSRAWRPTYATGLIVGALVWLLMFVDGTRVAVSIPPWQLALGPHPMDGEPQTEGPRRWPVEPVAPSYQRW